MTQYAEDLKAIVGIKALENKLKDLSDKVNIPGQRGVAVTLASGAVQGASGSSGSNGVSGTSELLNGLSDALTGASGALFGLDSGVGGSISDAAAESLAGQSTNANSNSGNAGNITKGKEDGVPTATEYFAKDTNGNFTYKETPSDGIGNNLVPNFKPGQTLSGISGFKDCTNPNLDVTVRFDKLYTPPPDRIFIDNDGHNATLFQVGWQWPDGAGGWVSDMAVSAQLYYQNMYLNGYIGVPAGSGNAYGFISGPEDILTGQYSITLIQTYSGNIKVEPPTVAPFQVNVIGQTCVPGSGDSCPLEQPGYYYFPVSNYREIAEDTQGNFVSHFREQPTPEVYHQPQSTKILCFGDEQLAKIYPNTLGGKSITELDANTGLPIGITRVYRDDGTLAAFTDASGAVNYALPNT